MKRRLGGAVSADNRDGRLLSDMHHASRVAELAFSVFIR
jgi:hypothetical protein